MARTSIRLAGRHRRKKHIRKKIHGTADRPRLCVFRSSKHIYAQVINDELGHTVASASSLADIGEVSGGNKDGARLVGEALAKKAVEAGIKQVVFDRNGHLYHGRVAALADGARSGGLEF